MIPNFAAYEFKNIKHNKRNSIPVYFGRYRPHIKSNDFRIIYSSHRQYGEYHHDR